MAKAQIDKQVITKFRVNFVGETDHVTLMVVVAAQLETLLAELLSRDKQI